MASGVRPASSSVAEKPETLRPAREAAYWRGVVTAEGADAEDWLNYGQALAALGFAARAGAAFRRGLALAPDHPALRLACAPPAGPAAAARRVDPDGIHIYLSAWDHRPDENDRADLARSLGTRDYSVGFAMRGFVEGLVQIGLPHTIIRNPQYIADIRARSTAACNIHLAFYPPEHLRLLKGAYNIASFAWEFDRLRLPTEVLSPHASADQATMLNLADELWVPSRHAAAAVARSVTRPVRTVPAPVFANLRDGPRTERPPPARCAALAHGLGRISWQPLAILPRDQEPMNHTAAQHRRDLASIFKTLAGDRPSAVFVTVLNAHDYSKQIRPMLQGFAEFSQSRPDAVLLVKSSTPTGDLLPLNPFLLTEQIFDVGERLRPIVSDRIWITDDVLTRDEMNHLYDLAGFYLCTSHAESQNLPLLEAMGRGVVPVSVDHTAMADYIRPDNAVPIRSARQPFDMRLSRRYRMFGLATHFADMADVRAALDRAIDLSQCDYATRSEAALETVRRNYGGGRLLTALRDVVAVVRERIGEAAPD